MANTPWSSKETGHPTVKWRGRVWWYLGLSWSPKALSMSNKPVPFVITLNLHNDSEMQTTSSALKRDVILCHSLFKQSTGNIEVGLKCRQWMQNWCISNDLITKSNVQQREQFEEANKSVREQVKIRTPRKTDYIQGKGQSGSKTLWYKMHENAAQCCVCLTETPAKLPGICRCHQNKICECDPGQFRHILLWHRGDCSTKENHFQL